MIGSSTVFSTTLGAFALGVTAPSTIGVASLLVTAAHAAESTTQRVSFACPNEQTLSVEFVIADPQAAAIVQPSVGPAVTLPALPRGDGFRYGNADHELRGKGDWVTWTEGSKPPITCTAVPSGR